MHILLLDNEEIMHTTLEFKLQKAGMQPVYINSTDELVSALEDYSIAVAILDLDIARKDISYVLDLCKFHKGQHIPVLGITTLSDEDTILDWLHEGIHDFIAKPYKTSEIIIRIKKAITPMEVK